MTDIIPISAVTDAATQQAAAPRRTDQLDKEAFMRLLVAQLKYQNPLSPSDPNQFMAQTAQFTMVESLEKMAQDASRQRAITESSTATAMIGRQITWLAADGSEKTGVVDATSFGTAGATLHLGDERVPLDRVSGVRSVAAPPAAPAAEESTTPPATDGVERTDPTPEHPDQIDPDQTVPQEA